MSAKNLDIAGTAERIAKRRHRSKLERRRIVEESFEPGVSVAVIARAHGVNANQVFHWRKLYRQGRLEVTEARAAATELMPVRIIDSSGEAVPGRLHAGAIQIELGRARLRVEGAVDPDTLRTILEHLGR
jgi:transposase